MNNRIRKKRAKRDAARVEAFLWRLADAGLLAEVVEGAIEFAGSSMLVHATTRIGGADTAQPPKDPR